jgi:hypothetical protein
MIHIIFKDECPGRPTGVVSILPAIAIENVGLKYKGRLSNTKNGPAERNQGNLYNENGRKNYKK